MGDGGDFGSGSGSKFNCATRVGSGRVGSDDLGYGPGSGFSFEPVQTSIKGTVYPGMKITPLLTHPCVVSDFCAVIYLEHKIRDSDKSY